MKNLIIALTLIGGISSTAYAEDVQHNLRVDGITCPFCVATSAKELQKIDGVKAVGSDLDEGLIKVCTDESVTFTDEALTKMFIAKGFTFKSQTTQTGCDTES